MAGVAASPITATIGPSLWREGTSMSDLIQLTKDGDIAIITINNPPVNAISEALPALPAI